MHRAGLPALPEEETYRRVRDHLTVMSERFRRNALAVAGPQSPLRPITGLQPATGYSTLAELRAPQKDFLQWVARCSRSGLLLNPTVVHGGTSATWDALYPGGQLLRINLSEDPVLLDHGLDLKRYAIEGSVANPIRIAHGDARLPGTESRDLRAG